MKRKVQRLSSGLLKMEPLRATGTFKIIDLNGKIIDITDEALFCRCGKSKTKPFCDGSHKKG